MSTNKSTNRDRLLLQQGMQQQRTRKTEGSILKPLLPTGSVPFPIYRNARDQQEHPILKIMLTLLVILCIYCLGSLSLAPHLLPSAFFHNQPSSPLPLSTGMAGGGGKCNAVPADVHYLPPVSGTPQNSTLPQLWLQAGYNEQDFASASACAASFLMVYLSFDFNQAQTFVACTAMLSAGGQQRFYGHASNRPADIRVDQLWRSSVQKQQQRQSAQTSLPILLKAQFDHARMLAWMQIHYQLIIHRSYEVFSRDDYMTVLVVSVPHNILQKGSGWQISDWRDGSGVFEPATPL